MVGDVFGVGDEPLLSRAPASESIRVAIQRPMIPAQPHLNRRSVG